MSGSQYVVDISKEINSGNHLFSITDKFGKELYKEQVVKM